MGTCGCCCPTWAGDGAVHESLRDAALPDLGEQGARVAVAGGEFHVDTRAQCEVSGVPE